MSKRDEQDFDFLDQVLPSQAIENKNETPFHDDAVSFNDQVRTSYLLVNALLNLLIQKGIIYPHEVNTLINELHQQLKLKRRSDR
jgi:hypothetical protein